MLELINNTPFQVQLFPNEDLQAKQLVTCVIKSGFGFNETGQLLPLTEIEPIVVHDQFYDNNPNASIAAAEESMPFKEGGEILVHGTAKPFSEQCRMTEVGVGLKFKNHPTWHKKLIIFGKRYWKFTVFGASISKPEFLSSLPLRYEYAFGGTDRRNPSRSFSYNPIGIGYNEKRWSINGLELPQIEQHANLISSPSNQPKPAGFGPISRCYQPRLHSQIHKLNDLHNVAPADQRFAETFTGGEVLYFSGLSTGFPFNKETILTLPRTNHLVKLEINSHLQILKTNCDTIVLNTDNHTLHLLNRVSFAWNDEKISAGYVIVE